PMANADVVSESTTSCMATFCIQPPPRATIWLNQYLRKLMLESAEGHCISRMWPKLGNLCRPPVTAGALRNRRLGRPCGDGAGAIGESSGSAGIMCFPCTVQHARIAWLRARHYAGGWP